MLGNDAMKLISFLAALLIVPQAFAASVTCSTLTNGIAPSGCAATVLSSGSTTMLAAAYPAARTLLIIDNEAASGGNSIACTFDGSAAAINTAGSITVAAATRLVLSGVGTPAGAINCIAATGSTAATIIAE